MIQHEHPIVQKLNETNLLLYLVGSRFMQTNHKHSDYDFLCPFKSTFLGKKDDYDSEEFVGKTLLDLGFIKTKDAFGYTDDGYLSAHYRWTDPEKRLPQIDVLCAPPDEVIHRVKVLNMIRDEFGSKLCEALSKSGSAWALLFKLMKNASKGQLK